MKSKVQAKQTSSDAKMSERQLKTIIDTVPVLVTRSRPDGSLDFINNRWLEYLNVSADVVKDWGWTKLTHPNDIERFLQDWRLAMSSGSPFEGEARVLRADGQYRWLLIRAVPVHDHNGKIVNWYATGVDIEDHKQAENALRRGEVYLAEAQRLSRTGSFGWNVSTGELIWSDETFSIVGLDRTVKPTLDLVIDRVHPEDIVLVQERLDRAIRDESKLDFEHRFLMPNGLIKHVHVLAKPTKSEAGELEFVGAVMDITERKRTAEALQASEKLARGQLEALRSILDAVASESAPERLVEHILRTITGKWNADSCSVWLRDEATATIGLEFAFEGNRIVKKTDKRFTGMDLRLPMEDFWPWPEVFRTGKPSLIEDIRVVKPFPLRDRLLPLGIITVLLVPMAVAGRLEGSIGLRFTKQRSFRPEEMDLAQALANQVMLAIHLSSLSEESREAAVVAERNRMARDIHDTLAQGFTGVIVQLEAAKGAAARKDVVEVSKRIDLAGDLARSSLGEARRSVRALRPRSLQDGSLCAALEDLLKRMSDGTSVRTEFQLIGDMQMLASEWEEDLLRIAQESLTNTIKHADARNFRVRLNIGAGEIHFRLVDDGRGFDLKAKAEGFGLIGIRERVEQMKGKFVLRSKPGGGTEMVVILKIPPIQSDDGPNEEK